MNNNSVPLVIQAKNLGTLDRNPLKFPDKQFFFNESFQTLSASLQKKVKDFSGIFANEMCKYSPRTTAGTELDKFSFLPVV